MKNISKRLYFKIIALVLRSKFLSIEIIELPEKKTNKQCRLFDVEAMETKYNKRKLSSVNGIINMRKGKTGIGRKSRCRNWNIAKGTCKENPR